MLFLYKERSYNSLKFSNPSIVEMQLNDKSLMLLKLIIT
jgi:hypothetical protein